ncbi:MAG TPA: pantoate--beta-alanine ligase [Gaiellaceae bacterium]|nr:pantoate--beta-alanine ligase [Gaiellaceae bacterium]
MRVSRTIAGIRAALEPARGTGATIGLVPTLGALHAGHEALLRRARAECDVVVASLFVNPAQFGPGEDLERYPRDEERDARLAEGWGVDHLFAPPAGEMYPPGFQTGVDVEKLSRGYEGDARPGHFRGVATVCLKLFAIVRPDRAYFGQKDAQQAAVVERMVRDLALELEIRLVPTVRDPDGLALSSRNVYLSREERKAALALPRALAAGAEAHEAGGDAADSARVVLGQEPGLDPEYVEVAGLDGRVYLLGAVRAGRTRLIDNVLLEGVIE